ncbi:hypothetical protein TRICI_000871 [Trichomonascus ciferrii]|uniref:Uncharacterized protein n=1 Tax=Trichomonascus ciferrii TaxID=44093 RepID=A0A642VB00_9ASCO|nr:hypothetical protein TRICI_000871 [Trichomonascus ciferrii]
MDYSSNQNAVMWFVITCTSLIPLTISQQLPLPLSSNPSKQSYPSPELDKPSHVGIIEDRFSKHEMQNTDTRAELLRTVPHNSNPELIYLGARPQTPAILTPNFFLGACPQTPRVGFADVWVYLSSTRLCLAEPRGARGKILTHKWFSGGTPPDPQGSLRSRLGVMFNSFYLLKQILAQKGVPWGHAPRPPGSASPMSGYTLLPFVEASQSHGAAGGLT